jgi:hypothetical protein
VSVCCCARAGVEEGEGFSGCAGFEEEGVLGAAWCARLEGCEGYCSEALGGAVAAAGGAYGEWAEVGDQAAMVWRVELAQAAAARAQLTERGGRAGAKDGRLVRDGLRRFREVPCAP